MYNILILLLLIIIIVFYNKQYENYDAIARNIDSIEKCADITSSIYSTAAFGYNPKNKNCYVSKTQLTYPIIEDFPYHGFSKPSDIICNKRLAIINQKDIADDTMILNRLYECDHNKYSTNANAKTTFY